MTARRKLLVVSPSLGEGGAQRVASTLLGHLPRERFDIELCLFKNVIEFAMPSEIPVTSLLDRDVSLGRKPWLVPGALFRLRSAIASFDPDVVLSVIDQANLVVAAALVGSKRCRFVGRAGANPANQSRTQQLLAALAYRMTDAIVANAAGLAKGLNRRYGGLEHKVVHLPNPIDFERIDALASEPPARTHDGSRPLIIFVGRLVAEKRLDVLIEAAAALRQRRDFELWICGGGPLTGAVRSQIRALGLERDVALLGFCDNPYSLCRQADAFVMTSDSEGLPNGLIEAQGLGLPAVATDCDYGPSEIIEHGSTGFLAPVDDAAAIADRLDALIADASARTEMGRAAGRRARSLYGVDVLIERWQRLLEGVD